MASPLSQMIQTPLCTFCKEEKITDWICSDCDKPLCYECKRCHLWDFERKDHKIVRAVPLERKDHDIVRAIPLESIAKVKQILKKIRCTNHKDHYYTNYCIECRCLVCPECVSILSIHSRHTFKTINTIHEETLQKLESEEIRIKQNLLTSVTRKLKSLKDWSTFHEKMFEEEKEKILKRADELKKWITECSDDMMNELKQNLVKNANVISQQKVKLEQLQKELKEKINIINKSKVKDDIEQILNDHVDVSNVSINTLHIPLIIPNETKQFSVSKKTKERLIRVRDFFGNFQNYDGTADVECKITNSYNLQGFHSQHKAYYNVYNTSVAVASDGTILIGNRQLLFEMKPDKNPRIKECKPKITDMLFLETNELVFAVEDSHAILLRNNHDEIRTLYTIPEVQNTILALCGNRDGNICILYSRHYTSLIYNRLSMFGTCYIAVISQNGILVRTITCEDKFLGAKFSSLYFYFSPSKFKMRENRNKNICILSLLENNVKAFSQDGNLRWKQNVSLPIDVESTPLGSIVVLSKNGQLFIFSSDGSFLKKIDLKNDLDWCFFNYCYSFCFKNDNELAIFSKDKFYSFLWSCHEEL
ncbi:unnamed protein product [Mytilus coruscus]|uniref:B box-type domain-containing protein n=1 Tax=Mytilus coruscus TaxID=42192 RepID=A0A6J8BL55_MYTCO|nr:unnamed protein product [Mytilus coruscus]